MLLKCGRTSTEILAMRRQKLLPLVVACLLSAVTSAQAPEPWHDDLIDHFAGTWTLTGNVMGREAHHEVQAEWVLNHQFLCIHEKTPASAVAAGERPYEAIWFLGYDSTSERYVLHLMDVYGPRFSEILGFGTREGNQVRFVFEYPDGPFHNTWRFDPAKGRWEWLMEQKDKSGKWAPFAELRLTQAAKP